MAPPSIDEGRLPNEPPWDYVQRLALAKARSIMRAGDLIIGADTVVVLGDELLNKPLTKEEAKSILEKLSSKTHAVYTGLGILCPVCEREDSGYDKTVVHFNRLTEAEIIKYIESGEPMDKAGAYGIQGMGSFLVERIEGELDTVIGLPRRLLKRMLEEHKQCLKA